MALQLILIKGKNVLPLMIMWIKFYKGEKTMLHKTLLKTAGLALGLMLVAGCQHQQEVAQQPAPTQPPAQQAAEPESAERNILAVHLAQQHANPEFIKVDFGEGKNLYALPKPVLTQADMDTVQAATTEDGQHFMVFGLTEQGAKKLADVSAQAQGHFFLFSARGQLVGVAKIDDTMGDGQLLMATENEEHTKQVLQLLR